MRSGKMDLLHRRQNKIGRQAVNGIFPDLVNGYRELVDSSIEE